MNRPLNNGAPRYTGRCALCDEGVFTDQEVAYLEGNMCHRDCAEEEGYLREEYDDDRR